MLKGKPQGFALAYDFNKLMRVGHEDDGNRNKYLIDQFCISEQILQADRIFQVTSILQSEGRKKKQKPPNQQITTLPKNVHCVHKHVKHPIIHQMKKLYTENVPATHSTKSQYFLAMTCYIRRTNHGPLDQNTQGLRTAAESRLPLFSHQSLGISTETNLCLLENSIQAIDMFSYIFICMYVYACLICLFMTVFLFVTLAELELSLYKRLRFSCFCLLSAELKKYAITPD